MNLDEFFRQVWKDRNLTALGFWPLSLLYSTIVEIRRFGFSCGLFAVEHFQFPIIVIGNLTVGGTGKTPLTIWAVENLKNSGYSPGVISRGYGRRISETHLVGVDSTPDIAGDEPLVIWRRTNVPVAVSRQRADAIRLLIKEKDCNIFISDDGLQHLSIESDLKIMLIDGEERFGNGFCLPAGPLRESSRHVHSVDLKLVNGTGQKNEFSMACKLTEAVNLLNNSKTRTLDSFAGENVSAIAGIRNPKRFFKLLTEQNIQSKNFSFPDHHDFTREDLSAILPPDDIVLMTEKDAVKCAQFASPNWWCVNLEAIPEDAFQNAFADRVSAIVRSN